MSNFSCYRLFALFTWLLFIIAGCAGTSQPIRHLSSDVCLVMPESTTRQEVLSFMGAPDRKTRTADSQEVWIYKKINKSFAKKMPLLGEKLGSQNYETVTVTFVGELVRTCLYREFNEAEYEKFSAELP